MPCICSQRVGGDRSHWRSDLLFLQPGLRNNLSKADDRVAGAVGKRSAAGITIVRQFFFFVELQGNLALIW